MSVIITGLQNRVKNSSAYAEELGFMLVANGEELPYVLTAIGEKIRAGINPPEDIPAVADDGSGNLTNGKFVVYKVVYASENSFPSVGPVIYSNPSPNSATYEITGSGNRQLEISAPAIDNTFVTHLYFYRTELQNTAIAAEIAADAGLMYFVGKVANTTGTLSIEDNTVAISGADPIQLINFVSPQFRFVVWDGQYFWGFANHPFTAQGSWDTDGSFSLTDTSVDKFFGGRDDQYLTFEGVTTGGIDGRGTFLFKQTGDFTGQAVDEAGADMALPSTAAGTIVITADTAILYRSGFRNPFQWGYLQSIGGIFTPVIWELKVSGSLGTAIAIVPNQQLLKLDMEFPALCVTYSLQTAATDIFSQTKRQVSKLYSVTSHFSQFVAVSNKQQVLWGMDFKNLAIVQSDGYTQTPISGPISILLRQLSQVRSLHLMSHGIYDPTTEINALWLPSQNTDLFAFNLCVYQHAPTGFWGIFADFGILSSGSIENPNTSRRSILVGTQNGFLGKAFDESTYGNWLPTNSPYQGYICAATINSITRSDGQDDFDTTEQVLIGNYCIVVGPDGMNVQLMKIAAVQFNQIIFENNFSIIPTTTDDPGLVDGQWQFFIGLIELSVLKYYDEQEPALDKAVREFWATLSNAEQPRVDFFPEHAEVATKSVELMQDTDLDAWKNKLEFPTKKNKTYGLRMVERSYLATKFFNLTLK